MGGSNSTESKYSSFQSYEDACQSDLKPFNSKLHVLTSQAINSLAADDWNHPLSIDSVAVVCNSLCEITNEVVKVILDLKEKIWEDNQLLDLVEDYFQLSCKTLDFCTAIEECLNRAQISHRRFQRTVQQFDEERGNGGVGGSEKNLYSMTLMRLEKFKTDDDKFIEEFLTLCSSLLDEQVSLRKKLEERQNKLDKRSKSMKIWKIVSMTIFGATCVLTLVCMVLVAATAVPDTPVVLSDLIKLIAKLGSTSTALVSGGVWLKLIWETYEKEPEWERNLITSMHSATFTITLELRIIRTDINNLKTKLKGLLQEADSAVGEEDASEVVEAIAAIKKKLTEFTQAIENLHNNNENCRSFVREALTRVLDQIKKYPST